MKRRPRELTVVNYVRILVNYYEVVMCDLSTNRLILVCKNDEGLILYFVVFLVFVLRPALCCVAFLTTAEGSPPSHRSCVIIHWTYTTSVPVSCAVNRSLKSSANAMPVSLSMFQTDVLTLTDLTAANVI